MPWGVFCAVGSRMGRYPQTPFSAVGIACLGGLTHQAVKVLFVLS